MTAATTRTFRHGATVNMLRMGHCAPSIAKTLLDVSDQEKDWAVKLAAGMPGGIANTGYECGGVSSPLIVLGLGHGLQMRDGLPEVVCRGQALCQQLEDRNGTLSCVVIRGGRIGCRGTARESCAKRPRGGFPRAKRATCRRR